MSRLDDAVKNLEKALERLDQAVSAKGSKSTKSNDDSAVWQTALKRAETQAAAAEQRNALASERLEAAIGRLNTLLQN